MSKNRKLKAEEKVDIVHRWQAGKISMNAASQEAGVDPETIHRWITRYKAEGSAGFLPQNQNRIYPPELKRQAVQEYKLQQAGMIQVCPVWRTALITALWRDSEVS